MARHAAAIFGCAGATLAPDEARFFAEARPWGFILFARNIETPAQVSRLTRDLRSAVGWRAPILVDQEGGRVQRMGAPHWRVWRPPLEHVAAAGDPERAMYLRARLIAGELHGLGIDVNCIPALDLARGTTHPFLRDRLYGSAPDAVARIGRAVAQGLMDGGVLPVMKHVPGHGLARVDSHADLPRVEAARDDLDRLDFAAFRPLADLPMAMTAHVVFASVDPAAPATLSRRAIGLIRAEIGFSGLLMTDDLSMGALPGEIGSRAAAARRAGCDVVLHCNGDRAEMRAVLARCGSLDGAAARRARAALDARRRPRPLDIPAAEAELAALLDGAVYA